MFSVGGGNLEKNVSPNIVAGLKEAKARGMKVFGVVGRDGGYTKQVGDCVVVVPTVDAARVTPHTEAFQAVVWHCLVSHPGAAANRDQVVTGEAQRRAVFLDRDGVINRAVVRDGKPYPPDSVAELEILPGRPGGARALRAAGFLLVVVTNQPDVGTRQAAPRGRRGDAARLLRELALDAVEVCYTATADGCACRKPKPGMLLEAAAEYGIDLARELHGRRPLARHRCRAGRRLPRRVLHRLRLPRAAPDATLRRGRLARRGGTAASCRLPIDQAIHGSDS